MKIRKNQVVCALLLGVGLLTGCSEKQQDVDAAPPPAADAVPAPSAQNKQTMGAPAAGTGTMAPAPAPR